MYRIVTFAIAVLVASTASATKDTELTHDADLINGIKTLSQSCANYALRKLGGATLAHRELSATESLERGKAWAHVAFEKFFEACIADAARELAEMRNFDRDDKKEELAKLGPLYVLGEAPEHVDATATSMTATTIRYGKTTMPLRDFLGKIWNERWRDVVVEKGDGAAQLFCLLHLGYISGTHLHVRYSDGTWAKAVLNASTGEKGLAMTINQCLSGEPMEESDSARDEVR